MPADPKVLAFVMAGGEGSRLRPLTSKHCKPAVPFNTRHRIVDFVLSNLVNSGIHANYLLVQYQANSLIEHVQHAWSGSEHAPEGSVTVVAPRPAQVFRGTADAVAQNIDLIRRHRPEVVVCGDPTVRFYGTTYMNHPDHRVAADVALDAVFPSAGTRLIFPELLDEGLDPHEVRQVYIHGAERADTWVDVGETLDLKLAALRAHKSQMGEWDPGEMITQWAREQGKRRKLSAAEAYRRMVLQDP